ncbi:TetR/AcrR family transcriptional regulator [Aquiflexum lacus]|uniref:TetR/AcrR family transcriptional regulator n=1 Tax=Aquiflexum lacus TaxID=2483805 RepID=UPI001894AB0D|nr:TetR/AcrR family transcriptional regulator [Aquiflexum lacus]
MGVSERKAKEKEELKSLILKAAQKLFLEKGIEQTSIRKIANEIEYSPGTVYFYYKDKNDILYDIHSQGFRKLSHELKVLFNVSDPMERIIALGRVYLNFAIENPDLYDLMFNMKAPMDFLNSIHQQDWNEGIGTFDVLKTTINQCMEKGYFKGHELEALSFSVWSLVHGIASLNISQRIRGVNLKEPEMMVMKSYEEFIMLLYKGKKIY